MATLGSVARIKVDPFTLLKEEHRQIKDLFEVFESAPDTVTRLQVAEQALQRLTVHAQVEEEFFYPGVRSLHDDRDVNALVDEAIAQHRVAERLIDELQHMSATEDGYRAKFRALAESVTQHMAEEEHDIFPRGARANINWDEVGALMQLRAMTLRRSARAASAPAGIHGHARDRFRARAPMRALSERHDR